MDDPYLSIVACSRNDDHGGHLQERMQAFIDGIVAQSERHKVVCELILVEWNPPGETSPLEKALTFPPFSPFCSIRIVQVSHEIHAQFQHSSTIPLFQMLGKNVGIRRAKGEFVLATNIDVLFSDEIFKFFKAKKLKSGILYRNNRLDIPYPFPKRITFDQLLSFCDRSYFRNHDVLGSKILVNNKWIDSEKSRIPQTKQRKDLFKKLLHWNLWKQHLRHTKRTIHENPLTILLLPIRLLADTLLYIEHCLNIMLIIPKNLIRLFYRIIIKASNYRKSNKLHTNGCGDFTLLSKKDWHTLKGYPEWNIFSWHLDSIFLYQACMSLTKEKNFGAKKPIYHIEHSVGSGYTPEGAESLFNRLKSKGIEYIDNQKFNEIIESMGRRKKADGPLVFNDNHWGLANLPLTESMPTLSN